ncbi:ABC transporter permease [Patescibacteria group bacterium]|nr:ABC transporter permease [Patescibacteria group bacterium]
MKPSVFNQLKEALAIRLIIIKTAIIYSFQEETAYPAENWGNMLSTLIYIATFRLFLNILYTNIDTLAGYTENEMLFFLLVGQASFYLSWAIYNHNIRDISSSVNTGNLDLVLTKPVPSAFYISFRKISLVHIFRDALAPLLFIIATISWETLHLNLANILIGIIICTLGITVTYCVYFLSVLPSFWFGRSDETYRLVYLVEDFVQKHLPLEGASNSLKILLGALIPLMIGSAFTTSVILGKSNALALLAWAAAVTILFLLIRKYAWGRALRAYTSASS